MTSTQKIGNATARISRRLQRRRMNEQRRTVSFYIGAAILIGFVSVAAVSRVWTPYPPDDTLTGPVFSAPGSDHPFGTDRVGADILSRTMYAITMDVGITLAVVAVALVIGAAWGAIAGFYGGWFDALTKRILKVVNAFPALLLALLVIAVAGPGIVNVILVVAILPLPEYVRIARAEVRTKRTWQFAEAARMVGQHPTGVLFIHIVPNSLKPLLTFATINASWVAATVGALGFLGLGIEPGAAEWGAMIARGQDAILDGKWWISFFPGVAMFLLACAFQLLSDGFNEKLVPRSEFGSRIYVALKGGKQ